MTLPPTDRVGTLRWYQRVEQHAKAAGRWPEAERWLGRHDLFYLLVRLLRRDDVNNDWLFARCREVQGKPNGCLDLWSRGHYKSTIQTFGKTIQDILTDPETTIGIFSHTRPIAKGFLAQIKREFEENEWLKALYPDVLYTDPRRESPRWSEDGGICVKRRSNPKENTVEAWGLVDGQPTSKHFRVLLYDDVVTLENVSTPEQVAKTTKALEISFNLGIPSDKGGVSRFIGTRYSLHDSYAALLKTGSLKARLYPATTNGRFDGKPVFWSDKVWADKLSEMTRPTVAAQLLQNPMADESATFRVEWLRPYEVRPRTLNVYILCDPSRGRSAESDNTAIAVVGIASGGAKFLLDGLCHRMTLSQRWTALKTFYRKWSRAVGVQHISVGYERYGAQSDDEYFDEQMRLDAKRGIRNAVFTINELNWPRDGTEGKRERVERLEPDFRNGRFYLPLPVWRHGKPSVWSVDRDPESKTFANVLYRDSVGLTKLQMTAAEKGEAELIAKAIKGVDQDGRVYDVTGHFIEEYSYFPFGRWRDLIDATSRLYDMEPVAPATVREEDVTPRAFADS